MKKIFLIPIFMLLLCSFAFAFDTASETIKVSYPEIKDPYLSAIKPIATNINVDKNTAYTEASDGIVSIDKFEANSGEEATIQFTKTSKDTLYDICISGFAGYEEMIKLQNFKKSNNWWFDDNLLNEIEKEGELYCFSSFQADDVTQIRFKAEYSGEGKLKYDIYILPASYNKNFNTASEDGRLIILDPYLIGTLATQNETKLYMKFDGNLNDSSTNNVKSRYILSDGLVAGYVFDINQNSNDISGNGNDGTDTGVSYIGTGASFDGVDDYINISNNYLNSGEFSIYFDFAINNFSNIPIFNKLNWVAGSKGLRCNGVLIGTPAVQCLISDNHVLGGDLGATIANLEIGERYQGFLTYNSSGTLCLKINGINEQCNTASFKEYSNNREFLLMTSDINGVYNDFQNGSLNNILIWNRSLSSDEISQVYTQGDYVDDSLGESDSAINLTNSYIYSGLNENPVSVSYWTNNGTWNHFVKSNTNYYLNGLLTTSFTMPFVFGNNMTISKNSNDIIDEVMIFNYSLSQDEIDILYNGFGGAFNIEFLDEKTGDKINNVTLEVFSESQSSNYSTTTGEFFLNGFPREITTIRYRADGYKENFYYIDFSDIDEQLFEATLYLLNESDSDEISITVYDNGGFNKLEGVYLKILKFFPEDNQFKIVGMAETNYNGVTKIGAEKNQEFYKFQLFYPDILTLSTTTQQSYIFENQLNLRLPIASQIGQGFNQTMGVVSTMKYNTVTDSFDYEYSNTAGTNVNTTVTVTKLVAGQVTVVNSSTGTSSAGTISVPVSIVNDTTYIATAVINLGDENGITNQLSYINYNENKIGNYGLLIIIILTLAFIFIGYFSLSIMVALVPLPLLFGSLMGIVQFDFRFAIVIQILAVIVSLLVKF